MEGSDCPPEPVGLFSKTRFVAVSSRPACNTERLQPFAITLTRASNLQQPSKSFYEPHIDRPRGSAAPLPTIFRTMCSPTRLTGLPCHQGQMGKADVAKNATWEIAFSSEDQVRPKLIPHLYPLRPLMMPAGEGREALRAALLQETSSPSLPKQVCSETALLFRPNDLPFPSSPPSPWETKSPSLPRSST